MSVWVRFDMASSYKSTETQLEFYKNNWELYENVRKEPPLPPKIIKKVNKIYNIDKDFPELDHDAELPSPLNKAFLDEEPGSYWELKPAEDSLDLPLEYLTPAQMRQTAEDWLKRHGVPVRQEKHADTYDDCAFVDGSAGCVRGAHALPHCSETVTSIAQEEERPCSCISSLSVYSLHQLARAIQRHHSALTLLLREQALRARLKSCSFLHPPIPFEDCPTRETDPLRTPDYVLSRSHRAPAAHQPADTTRTPNAASDVFSSLVSWE